MTLPQLSPADFLPLYPALILTVGSVLLLLSEVFLRSPSRGYQPVLAVITAVLAGITAVQVSQEPAGPVFNGMAVLDPFSATITAVVCLALALAVLISAPFLHDRGAERGEFYALMLFAAAGMSLLALSAELITLFVSLEILSVATYALTSYLRRGARHSEAGFKYFILGAFSSALLLYGASLIYGATGSTHLAQIAARLGEARAAQPGLVYCGVALVGAGFAFKVAAVPFHMWTPDVYEGAPTPVTALMSAAVKASAFAAMIRVAVAFSHGLDPQSLVTFFSLLAVATMVLGNLIAIPQRNVKRMLAYSSIAHAGYLLVGVAALFGAPAAGHGTFDVLGATPLLPVESYPLHSEALRAIFFYLLAYSVTSVGSFGILAALERREDENRGTAWDLERFAGLVHRRPGWAVTMAVFMLSLGGIPPTVGFMGKLLVFQSAIDAGLLGLVIVGALTSAASVYYYLRVVVYMFMRPAPEGVELPTRRWPLELAVVICTAAIFVWGILPGRVLSKLNDSPLLPLGPSSPVQAQLLQR